MTEGWVFDLDGVVWRGAQPIPGVAAAIADLIAAGVDVLFVTNMSGNPVRSVEEKLSSFGIDG